MSPSTLRTVFSDPGGEQLTLLLRVTPLEGNQSPWGPYCSWELALDRDGSEVVLGPSGGDAELSAVLAVGVTDVRVKAGYLVAAIPGERVDGQGCGW
jgi:hypothetical protein